MRVLLLVSAVTASEAPMTLGTDISSGLSCSQCPFYANSTFCKDRQDDLKTAGKVDHATLLPGTDCMCPDHLLAKANGSLCCLGDSGAFACPVEQRKILPTKCSTTTKSCFLLSSGVEKVPDKEEDEEEPNEEEPKEEEPGSGYKTAGVVLVSTGAGAGFTFLLSTMNGSRIDDFTA